METYTIEPFYQDDKQPKTKVPEFPKLKEFKKSKMRLLSARHFRYETIGLQILIDKGLSYFDIFDSDVLATEKNGVYYVIFGNTGYSEFGNKVYKYRGVR